MEKGKLKHNNAKDEKKSNSTDSCKVHERAKITIKCKMAMHTLQK